MERIILQIVCYIAVLVSFAPLSETSATVRPTAASSPRTTIFTFPPITTFSPKGTLCEGVRCTRSRHCALDENNKPACVCDGKCYAASFSPVCGSDNKTYSNYCEVTRKACMANSNLTANYYGECRYEASICIGITCPLNRVCAVAGNRAMCVCLLECSAYNNPVCGTDNQTYINDCYLRRQSCLTNKNVTAAYYAQCKQATACDGFLCPTGMKCAIDERKKPVCVCTDKCPYAIGMVCGTDGRTYGSDCEVLRSACTSSTSIRIAYKGHCLKGSVCSGYDRCPKNRQCNVNQDNKPVCVCSQSCSNDYDPVCGSDGTTYHNLCYLEMQACNTGTNLTMVRKGQCSYDAFCNEVVCTYPKTCVVNAKNQTSCVCKNNCGKEYYPVCGSDNKTYDNHCWFIYAACQRNFSTTYYTGVCSSGSGCQGIYCPYGQHCDSLHQSKPKCVCDTICPKTYSPICGTNNKTYNNSCELQKDSCLNNNSIWTNFNRRCEDGPGCSKTYCTYGRACALDEHNQPMCVCSQICAAGSTEVCGMDNKTYTNECFLRSAACMTNKTITVQRFEPCKKDSSCSGVVCPSDKYCTRDTNGRPICVCNEKCTNTESPSPVCGSDNKTYSNFCELQKKACISSSSIRWLYYGACAEATVCDKISCPPDKRCAIDDRKQPTCVCIDQCPNVQDWVCGSDGRSYNNECEMRKAACLSNRNVTIKYRGNCYKGLTCSDISCPDDRVCALNEKNQPTCVCNTVCYPDFPYPVCGTDGMTYITICHLQREACTKNKNIQKDYTGSCTRDASLTTTKKPCVGPSCTTSRTTPIQ